MAESGAVDLRADSSLADASGTALQ